DSILEKGQTAFSAEEFKAKANDTEAIVLDVRHEDDFVKEHIPGSIFIGLHGGFAPWVGALIRDVNQPLLLITPEGKESETITRLARVGFDASLGYLKGGINAWKAAGFETDSIVSVSPEAFAEGLAIDNKIVVDSRKPGEFNG